MASARNLKSSMVPLVDKSNEAMDDFIWEMNESGLQRFVKGAFYDSRSDFYVIKFRDDSNEFETFSEELLRIARKTLKRFDWFGVVQLRVLASASNLTWHDF